MQKNADVIDNDDDQLRKLRKKDTHAKRKKMLDGAYNSNFT